PLLAVLAVALIVALAAGITLLGFRGVTVEPLGVLRQAEEWRGRLWWRLVPLAASVPLLYPVLRGRTDVGEGRTGLGVVLLIATLIPILPYLVPLVARLLPADTVSWQLASQQLRRNPASSTRAVGGIVVAVAGAIALQSVFAVAGGGPHDPDKAAFLLQARGAQSPAAMRERTEMFERVDGLRAGTVAHYLLFGEGLGRRNLIVGDCRSLSQIAVLQGCRPGAAFTTQPTDEPMIVDVGATDPVAGPKVAVPARAGHATMIDDTVGGPGPSVLLTTMPAQLARVEPSFVETRVFTTARPAEVAGQVRAVAAEVDPLALFTGSASETDPFGPLRVALDIGSLLVLLLMTVGLLLDVASRLHERRRILGVLAAVGARNGTVVWSVLLQVVVPIGAGLVLAVGAGTGIGALLMRLSQLPVTFTAATVLTPVAAGAGLVLVTTMAVLLPAVRRVTRTEDLRFE
ncbi:ABC transporter permease, partial [Actinoplanes philippinensis]|uniref:ABC transporter permease n=1 Tax=Actinoplanes philippinensis TaxID=35752 RepID=UPI003410AFEE